MKTAKKILSTILAGALMAGMAMMPASAAVVNAKPADLFVEDFESKEISTSGDGVVNTMARNGEKSYVITENGTEPKLEIPVGEVAEDWVDKMLVAEAWYHIDGTLQGYKSEIPEGATEAVVSGEQVTMAFYKDAETVNEYKPNSSNKYPFKNAVWPNTNTEGWYRIRTTGVIQSKADLDLSQSKLVIGLVGAGVDTKLYVDDVKIFITDNIMDMCTQGNSDFDTYDHTGISAYSYWQSNKDEHNTIDKIGAVGTVEYSKEHPTSGEYGLKYTRIQTAMAVGEKFGVICDVPLGHFGAPEGSKVIVGANIMTNAPTASFWKRQIVLRQDHLQSTYTAINATGEQKTIVYGIFTVPKENSAPLRIVTNSWYNVNFDTTTSVYVDDVFIKVVPEEGFTGFKKSATSANETEKSISVNTLSNGDTVYPFAYFAADQAEKVTIVVARYVKNGESKRLDDISVKTFDSYKGKSFDTNQSIETEAITVPSTGEYTYKIMTWGEIGGLTSLLDTTTYEVK